MKPARDCKDRLDDIVAFVMGEIDAASAEQLQAHLETCDSCRAACDCLSKRRTKSAPASRRWQPALCRSSNRSSANKAATRACALVRRTTILLKGSSV